MSSELPFEFNPPPTEFDPGDSLKLAKVLKDPTGVPLYRHKTDVEDRFEEITAATGLSDEYQWFALGLAYCMIKIDRSIIEAYRDALGQSLKIKSHLAPKPIVQVPGSASWANNPWAGTIQGIPQEHAGPFIDYAASHVFRQMDSGHDWMCNFRQIVISDPFRGYQHQVTVWVALPRNDTLGRSMRLIPYIDGASLDAVPTAVMVKDGYRG